MRKLIVLDLDGVIHTYAIGCWQVPHPLCVANLNMVLAVTQASILVSSSWRGETIPPMRAELQSWGIWGRVVGVTPRLVEYVKEPPYIRWQSRETEIQSWLATHRPYDRMVILDDEADGFIDLKPYLVQCSIDEGLTTWRALEAIAVLEGGVDTDTSREVVRCLAAPFEDAMARQDVYQVLIGLLAQRVRQLWRGEPSQEALKA